MNTAELILNKANPLLPAEDFDGLRKEGIHHIEKLGSANWTEYNVSDPGITILEAVCYAITDLSYRTGFDMKDLLTPEHLGPDTFKKIFYTARQILHSSPLTITDYRKLIIDIEGVRNAWVEMSKDYEVPLFVDYSYVNEEGKGDCGCEEKEPCLGRLALELAKAEKRREEIDKMIAQKNKEIAELNDQINAPDSKKDKDKLRRQVARLQKLVISYQEAITYTTQSKILELEGLLNVMVEYEEDVIEEKQRDQIREKVVQRLHTHRNLCEDFISVNSVVYDDFSVMGLFVLKENANPEEVFARICFEIYRYFTPSVRFYTIDQMMEKINPENGQHYTVEEIFEGPALKHGFIDTQELEGSDLFRDFRLSDLINAICDVEGVVAVTNLYIPFDAAGNPLNDLDDASVYFNDWIRELRRQRRVARLKLKNSKFIFLKQREVFTYDFVNEDPAKNRAVRRFEDLKTQDQDYKLRGHQKDFPVPVGEYMELENYYPVQYSLPQCYGVGEYEELPETPVSKRDTQAYQLKCYLLFFEQILANYHAQLNHLRDIFSFDEKVDQTYYAHLLFEINNLKELIIDHDPMLNESTEHFFEEFGKILQDILEPEHMFLKRRNAFLDHMLARFGEDLTEYEALTRYVWKDKTGTKLIGDKIRLLQDYVRVSKDRGEGLNYTLPDQVWDTENISGAERRIGRLLGFSNITRHSLAVNAIVVIDIVEEKPAKAGEKKDKVYIQLVNTNADNQVILSSRPIFKDNCCIDETVNLLLGLAESRVNFYINGKVKSVSRSKTKNQQSGSFRVELRDKDGDIVAVSNEFGNDESARKHIELIMAVVRKINDNEGMHLVEHLLLRPKLDTVLEYADYNLKDYKVPPAIKVNTLDICLDACDLGKGLGQNTDSHDYKIKISRLPADKCYNDEAWVMELIRVNEIKKTIQSHNSKGKPVTIEVKLPANRSILFKTIALDNKPKIPDLLSFRHYEQLQDRLADLREFGSEISNYQIQRYTDDIADGSKREDIKYYFEIKNPENDQVLARSIYYGTIHEARTEIEAMVRYLGYQLDLYCQEDPCDHNEDPYSFRVTIVLPCWVRRFRDKSYRNFVEKTIRTELPAHIAPRIKWVGISQMKSFEDKYQAWLEELLNNPYPEYGPVNALVYELNNLVECGSCEPDHECSEMSEDNNGNRYFY
ncbi:ABC transporter C-terminal domain-containing protein [Dyadobacter psychrophilus]|uniref:Uncharacterized protein n=1 Tax=Dyadobacter psychrophilus TaxID=651661 RepID=A0A1T5DKR3_9BACT|nr:ABC transporter C-terminal domain-containing protein [Dyadobacter psychrophilus]SKB72207.1 hypothetical protein SAMN05660293_01689 [Dyadobacter psychrophilus]